MHQAIVEICSKYEGSCAVSAGLHHTDMRWKLAETGVLRPAVVHLAVRSSQVPR